MNDQPPEQHHKRRVRYPGSHPKHFHEKYKDLNPEQYPENLQKVMAKGNTPAGMHRSICVQEILEILKPTPGQVGLDATLGYGGHTQELLACVQPGGKMFGIDVDPIELARTEQRLRGLGFGPQELELQQLNFAGICKLLQTQESGFDFILADLGISSMQLDNPERGFTYKRNGPLDLRLNPQQGQPASALLKTLAPEKLALILRQHADEPHAQRLAEAIVQNSEKINTTGELTRVIKTCLSAQKKGQKPIEKQEIERSTRRTFQALRIAVNDEFAVLDQFLRDLPFCLKPAGKVAILTFHSGEDKRVEQAFQSGFQQGLYADFAREAIRPGAEERFQNPRSKSARLRWAIRSQ